MVLFNNILLILLWHESEDINTKRLFPKFQLIPILYLHEQVMHYYVHWYCSMYYCVTLILVNESYVKVAFFNIDISSGLYRGKKKGHVSDSLGDPLI